MLKIIAYVKVKKQMYTLESEEKRDYKM